MTPAEVKEAERATIAFHTALNALGVQTIAESLSLWQDVPPVPTSAAGRAASRWLATAVAYVLRRRIPARNLAMAYYRYQRALATGTTIAIPGQDNPEYITLPELKRLFEEQLQVATEGPQSPSAGPTAPSPSTDTPKDSEGSETRIPVEEIPGLAEMLAGLEEDTKAEFENNLYNLGPRNLDNKIDKVDGEEADQDKGRAKAHTEAGNRQAASTARGAMNGARGPLYLISSADKRAIGWIRVSQTGTPCGFCAMLISRGFTEKSGMYASKKSAQHQGNNQDEDKYHDNCHCIAIPVFSKQQLQSDELFALNRKYAELWPIVTDGLGGKSAMRAWRRFITEEAQSQKSPEAAA